MHGSSTIRQRGTDRLRGREIFLAFQPDSEKNSSLKVV